MGVIPFTRSIYFSKKPPMFARMIVFQGTFVRFDIGAGYLAAPLLLPTSMRFSRWNDVFLCALGFFPSKPEALTLPCAQFLRCGACAML